MFFPLQLKKKHKGHKLKWKKQAVGNLQYSLQLFKRWIALSTG